PLPVVAASLERLADSLASSRRTGRWLDVGYGEGALLEVAGRRGWQCYGTEVAPQALRHGAARGWVVSAAPEADPRFPPAGFDAVSMIGGLEHVPTPERVLGPAAHGLRPGGALSLTPPNGDSLNRRLLGLDWSVVAPPEHLTLWTARGLCHALA